MSDTQCNYALKSKKFEETSRVSEDNTDEACVKDKQLDGANNLNRNSDAGVLKEQNFFVDNSGVNTLSKLYSNRSSSNSTYICSKKEKPLAGVNDIRKVCDDIKNNSQNEENSIFPNVKINVKENNDINLKNISIKSNDSDLKEVNSNDINGASVGVHNQIGNMLESSESPEVIYYAVHIPVEFALPDVLGDRKGKILIN